MNMESSESIRTDASTIHRAVLSDSNLQSKQSDNRSSESGSEAGTALPHGPTADLEGAQTVIRGSSRVAASPNSFETLDRTPAAVAKVLLGQRLNHFLLEELIGGGGMGAVFRARDEQLDRIVAIKVIPFVGEDPDLQRRFRNEAQSAARLDHPNIARVFDVGSQDDWHYIVFEYIRGVNIRDQISRDGPHSIDDAIYYTCQLADAIQHAAERGIVHRDIKPSNVLINNDDQVKLVDMGLARSENLELSGDMTASGVTLGTFDYISPEQARDPRDADVRSDIYSLGCTLYYMLTGRPPYPGGTMLQKLLSHGNAPPPDPRLLRAEVSDDLTAIIHKMLAKSPDERYQTARDLIADLKELASRENLSRAEALGIAPAAPASMTLQWVERHLPWMIAAMILLVSTLWLQLVSVASRDEFSVLPPESAALATQTSVRTLPMTMSNSVEAGGTVFSKLDSNGLAEVPSVLKSTSQPTGASVASEGYGDAAEPPSMAAVPIPRGLSQSNTASSTETASVSSLNPVDVAMNSPATTDATTSEIVIAPSIIRIVGPEDSAEAANRIAGVAVTRSLAEALRLAAKHEVNSIELATPLVHSEPVTVERDGLVLKSIVGGTVIQFENTENLSMQRSRMMSIGANRIEFQDIHLRWTVGSSEIDGGSLIAMNDNRLVRLSNCTMTIENPSRRDEVFAFEVVTDPEMLERRRGTEATTTASNSLTSGALPLVAIELENVIIRGEMTMIFMDFAAELQLQWDNGLLAVSRRMIDTAGALQEPSATAGPIQLSINRLTAYVPRGIVRMRLGVSGGYPVVIDREARNSVFEVDAGVPHFEINGLENLDEVSTVVRLRGEANAYDAETTLSDPVLMTTDRAGKRVSVTMNDLLKQSYYWEDERSPRWAVRWSRLELPGVSPSQFTPADFRQDGTVLSGFEERLLPRLPIATTATDLSDTNIEQNAKNLPAILTQ